MNKVLQPAFKIRVLNDKNFDPVAAKKKVGIDREHEGSGIARSSFRGRDAYIDIETCCAFPVTYTERKDTMATLTFSVDKFADVLFRYFHLGQQILLYGGTYADEEANSLKLVFHGTLTRLQTTFDDNGRMSFSVECMDAVFNQMGKDPKDRVFPDPDSFDPTNKGESMTIEECIKRIAQDNQIEVAEIDISPDTAQYNLDKIHIRYQKDCTDWAFLSTLASQFHCSLWVETEGEVQKLHFVSVGKLKKRSAGISFFYPLAGIVTDIKDSEVKEEPTQKEYSRPRMLRDVSVDVDMAAADSIARSVTWYDEATGQERNVVQVMSQDAEGRNEITYYELDEARVAEIDKTRPDLAKQIRDNGPTGMRWGDPEKPDPRYSSYYYKAVKHYDADEAANMDDTAFYGISISATVNMDLNIRSQRSYKIRGLMAYKSTKSEETFYLKELKHVWDRDGCRTEMDFMK